MPISEILAALGLAKFVYSEAKEKLSKKDKKKVEEAARTLVRLASDDEISKYAPARYAGSKKAAAKKKSLPKKMVGTKQVSKKKA